MVQFALNPSMSCAPQKFEPRRIMLSIFFGPMPRSEQLGTGHSLQERLLPQSEPLSDLVLTITSQKSFTGPEREDKAPNLFGANVIVVCDVLNALGTGFSLKFKDLYLKVDYGVSPAGVFFVAFVQNMVAAFLTPYANNLFVGMRKRGYRTKLGVVMLWSSALFFLGMLIIPGMPLWVVLPSMVMMQALNSCTRAYNRAQLTNYLPPDKIASYMAWDALNKANQGGVAIFGAQVVEFGGYRACFLGTFIIFSIRTLIYLAYTLRKGGIRKKQHSAETASSQHTLFEEEVTAEDMHEAENVGEPDLDGDSQMFRSANALPEEHQKERKRRMSEVQALPTEDIFSSAHGPGMSPQRASP